MKQISREGIQRMITVPQASGGGGGGSFDPTAMGLASEAWVEENYISKAFFNRLFTIHSASSVIDPNDPDEEQTIDSIESLVGFWTEYYLSALGQGSGGGGGGGVTLNEPLSSINTQGLNAPTTAGSALVWYNGAWTYSPSARLQVAGLNSSAAVSVTGSVTATSFVRQGGTSAMFLKADGSVDTTVYAAQDWVNQNFITIAFFETLFNAVDVNGTKINANTTTGIDSIKAMFGFWTNQYLSALGQGSGGGGGGVTLNQPLSSINSAGLAAPSVSGSTLVWNGTTWTYSSSIGDTKNTAGSSAQPSGVQLYLIGASAQATWGVTYSNSGCYIGTDGYLYSGGAKVLTSAAGFVTGVSVNNGNPISPVNGVVALTDIMTTYGGTMTGSLSISGSGSHLSVGGNIGAQGTITSQDYITATGFKTPNGTSAGFLKADGSVDTTSYSTSDTLNTAGATAQPNSVIYLVGAGSYNSTYAVTYTNSGCYISADGYLYSGGVKVITSTSGLVSGISIGGDTPIEPTNGIVQIPAYPVNTDTLNTAGSTQKPSNVALYLVGASAQATYGQTYSDSGCYISADGYLYSGGVRVLTSGNTVQTISINNGTPISPTNGNVNINCLTSISSSDVTTALGYTPAASSDLANYLPLTGGTLKKNAADILFIYSTTDDSYIRFQSTKNGVAYIRTTVGWLSEQGAFIQSEDGGISRIVINRNGVPQYWYDYSNWKKYDLIHAGNIGNYSVGYANLLSTSRSIWGQGFNGGADITGAMASVTNIDALLYFDTTNHMITIPAFNHNETGIFLRELTTSEKYNMSILSYDHNGNIYPDGISINGYDGVSICTGSNSRQERMRVAVNGNVGIGTTSPNYKLDVNGTIYCSGLTSSGAISASTSITAGSIIKTGGTSAQFLKADGSVDSTTYSTTDTVNTAGATAQPNSIIYLVGAGSYNSTYAVTYTNSGCYIGTDGYLYSGSSRVLTSSSGLATETWVGQNYLPLTGGKLTGTLTINPPVNNWAFQSTKSGTSTEVLIGYHGTHGQAIITKLNSSDYYCLNISRYTEGWASVADYILYARSDGKVGIGTGTPETKLHVNGMVTINAFGANETGIMFREGILSVKYNHSILSYDHNGNGSTPDGISINGYDGVSICTGSNTRQERFRVAQNGNVGIGTTSPSYLLDINGSMMCSGLNSSGGGSIATDLTVSGHVYTPKIGNGMTNMRFETNGNVGIGVQNTSGYLLQVNGACAGTSWTNLSDMRQKNYVEDESIELWQVAGAPLFKFTWKNNAFGTDLHVGTSAQYWQTIVPEAVTTDGIGNLGLQYDVVALLAAITTAKKVQEHERRIEELERENKVLWNMIASLKAA